MASDGEEVRGPKRPRVWPGMPTRKSQMFESFVMLFPLWLVPIGLAVALLMPRIQSYRQALQERGGEVPPVHAHFE